MRAVHRAATLAAPLALLISCAVGLLESAGLHGSGFASAHGGEWRGLPMHDILENVIGISEEGDVDAAIVNFDAYSESHNLGMNLGVEKGDVVEETVREALAQQTDSSTPFAVLEVGAHFGDGTLRIVRALQKHAGKRQGIIVSFEDNSGWASGCLALLQHVLKGRGEQVHHETLIVQPGAVVRAAQAALEHFELKHFNVVLLDHDHKRYLQDLKGLVTVGAVAPGGIVHADNAGRDARILEKYLRYVQDEGPFETRFEEIRAPYPDRVAISQYLPPKREL